MQHETDIYVSTTFAPDNTPLEQVLESCSEYEINAVELGSNHSFSADFARIVRDFGGRCLVHNYFPIPRDPFVMNMASADAAIGHRSVEHALNALRFCADVGAPLYTFHPGFMTDPAGPSQSSANYDFGFADAALASADYSAAYDRMCSAIETILAVARSAGVRVAIETQGAVERSAHLMMQRPAEYERFFRRFYPSDIGVNLNLGHVPLAARAAAFSAAAFVDMVAAHVVAIELSHNNGIDDEHRPLREDGWYWGVLGDSRFDAAFKILEFRNASFAEINASADMIRRKRRLQPAG